MVRLARAKLPVDAQLRATNAGLWELQFCPDEASCYFEQRPRMTSSDQPTFAISIWFEIADGRAYVVNLERTGETVIPSLWCEVGTTPCRWSPSSA
jgi:hypothetical protein